MHSIEELGTNVPAFLAKLWKIVEDPDTNDLICWSQNGASFFIRNQVRFSRELLPLYYKHNNMASFVRQLNMYGFHKVVSVESGGLKADKDEMEFAHQCFIMGHPYLLEHIKRKISSSKVEEGRVGSKPEIITKVLADVKTMKGRQDTLDSQLGAMKRENEVLWREVAILRQKHMKQQQIVNKLIQFLVTMVQSSRNGGLGIKRHYPLMLNDTSHRASKITKLSGDLNAGPNTLSPTGPVIHELDASDLLEECADNAEKTMGDDYLCPDLCSTETATQRSPNSRLIPNQAGSPDPAISNPSPEALLELAEEAEECPLSPSMLLTPSPMENSTPILSTRISKGKNKAKQIGMEGKKRRSKRMNSANKTITTAAPSTASFSSKDILNGAEEESLDSGVDLLAMVLPTLENDKVAKFSESNTNSEETNTEENALEAATDEAISAISRVAAARKGKSSKSFTSPSGKNIYKTSGNDNVPILSGKKYASMNLSGESLSDNNASSSTSDITNYLMNLKPETSTSEGKSSSGPIMTVARTGSVSEDPYDRSGLDSHVDSMQNELDNIRELLKGEGYSLDANTLLGVCAAIPAFEQDFIKLFNDDPLSSAFEDLPEDQEKETTGSELATYSSNLLDMDDMFGTSEGEWVLPSSPGPNTISDVSLSELNTLQKMTNPSAASKKMK